MKIYLNKYKQLIFSYKYKPEGLPEMDMISTCDYFTGDIAEQIVEQFKFQEHNHDMANGIIHMVAETLEAYPCIVNGDKGTPKEQVAPMMYPEWISNVINQARIQGMEAMFKYLPYNNSYLPQDKSIPIDL